MTSNSFFVVNIKGGFGNQLFQYNFANFLKELGYKVKIDNSFYSTTVNEPEITNRKEILNSKLFDFKNINKYETYLIKKLIQFSSKKRFPFLTKIFKLRLFENVKEKDFSIHRSYPKIVYCDGYWQDLDFLTDDGEFIKSKLMKISIIKKAFSNTYIKDSFMLIVRRGDYLKMEQDLKLSYYEECLDVAKQLAKNPIINIFTDDVNWVNNQEIFNNVNSITGPEDDSSEVIKLFSNMIQNQHYFIGNSTLSFYAAIVGKKHDSKIFVAEPWFRNRETKNLLHSEWGRIKNF